MIGDRIKQARLMRGLTQEELGAKIGVQKAAINKYETGVVTNLKRSKIAALAQALDVRPSWLMGFDDEQDAPQVSDLQVLIEFAKSVPEEKAGLILKVMKSILEADR